MSKRSNYIWFTLCLILFVVFSYLIYSYTEPYLSPGESFNSNYGSLLLGFFIVGLFVAFVAALVFFYFILHEYDH